MADRTSEAVRSSRSGRMLLASGGALLVAAGLLLWWRRGAAVFSDAVLTAFAWCF